MATSNGDDRIEQDSTADTDRRDFIKGSAVAGLIGAAAVAGTAAAAAPASTANMVEDPKRPAGLGPRAMLDARFPVMYEETVPNGVRVLTQYFKAISQRDLKAVAQTLQFPFGTYESVNAKVVNTPEEFFNSTPPSMNMNETPQRYTNSDSYMKAGSYDVFKGLEVLNWSPVAACMAMTYDRYDKYGKRLLRCDGIYAVTNNDGKWGIELMSTIFTPNDMVGVVYRDTIEQAMLTRRNHVLGGNFNPPEEESNKISYQPYGPAFGLGPGGKGRPFGNATEGTMMDVYKIKGVKSRLRVNNARPEDRPHTDPVEYAAKFSKSGVGNFGFVFANPDMRVIHHTADKAHLFSGAARYNVWGEHVSLDSDLAVITYKHARWGNQGTFALTQVHDRANDVAHL